MGRGAGGGGRSGGGSGGGWKKGEGGIMYNTHEMNVISSQRYIDDNIVDEKVAAFEANGIPKEITLDTWEVNDGNNTVILYNGHHTLEAAKQLGIKVNFTSSPHPERIDGENLLNQAWMDSDWRDVVTGKLYY